MSETKQGMLSEIELARMQELMINAIAGKRKELQYKTLILRKG